MRLPGVSIRYAVVVLPLVAVIAWKGSSAKDAELTELTNKVARGRMLVIEHGCGDCHGGIDNPGSPAWLSGARAPEQEFKIGPFRTYPRNITPDNTTGMGRFSERQIFNALRYGLRPGETPDVDITSSTPGQGNYPATPKYLAPRCPGLHSVTWPTRTFVRSRRISSMA